MKTLAKVLVIALLVCLPIGPFAQTNEGQKGDVNDDGTINVLDIVSAVNHILGINILDEQGMWRADCNAPVGSCDGDGVVNILDALKIVNIILRTDACVPPSCGTVTDIDGNTYQTVQIGDQCWMAENLKVTHYRNGDAIPNVIGNSEWRSLSTGAYCDYENNLNNVGTYGRLYNWYAVDDSRKIAPAGWHVPTDEEWKKLEVFLGMSQSEVDEYEWRGTDEGGKMKTTGTIEGGDGFWHSSNTGATNESGFSALPGGDRQSADGFFNTLGYNALFWSSTEYMSDSAWMRFLTSYSAQVGRAGSGSRRDGYSVRCVKDSECETVTDIDNNTYQTVQIGDQCWMAENLKVTHYRNGDPIPNITDDTEWSGLSTGAYCNYSNDTMYVATYGRLYNWYAVHDSRKIAPAGWHVPNDEEWQVLENFLGGYAEAGGKMKEAGISHWISPNTGATNESDFTALPGGYRTFDGTYYHLSYFAEFWSSSDYSSTEAHCKTLRHDSSGLEGCGDSKTRGLSVRCVKD